MSITGHEDSLPAACEDWSYRPHLAGLRHGHFHQAPELAARIKAAPAEDDIRFRGEHLSVHTIDGVAYAVLWEEWFSPAASTWVQHPSAAAARSWTHQLAAYWLRDEAGSSHGSGTLQSWDGGTWAAERDLTAGRWHLAIGFQPGVTYTSTETEDRSAGWAFLTETLTAAGFPPETWPAAMRQIRHYDLPAPDPARAPVPAPVTPPGPETWRTLLRRLLARILAGLGRAR
ncbi:hypothetical protein AB0O22_17845 [Streptomyces sp. NPDC091204]|uniref:hypothetical protein n=1 Tax=Streptomyces sp. NPDC091204 TaxID=3155299 RepID=UPI00341C72CD